MTTMALNYVRTPYTRRHHFRGQSGLAPKMSDLWLQHTYVTACCSNQQVAIVIFLLCQLGEGMTMVGPILRISPRSWLIAMNGGTPLILRGVDFLTVHRLNR
jgi:hypothetical protein